MNRRLAKIPITVFFISVGVVFLFSCQSEKKQKSQRPNIVIILADDMGYSDIGCFGGEIETPNIDRMAAEGLRFTQFYNAARCCPTRASLLTGLYPHEAGMGGMVHSGSNSKGPYQGYLNDECVTIAEVLKEAGYYTAASGKWHVGEERPHWPVDRGFDNYFGLISGAANYFDISKTKTSNVSRHFAIDSTEYIPNSDDFYMTNAITENAIKYLKVAEEKEQPFFMYLAYTAPHWPLHALQEDIDRFRGKFMKGWDQLRIERYDRMVKMGIIEKTWDVSERDPMVKAWNSLTEEEKDRMDLLMSIYAAQIYRMDVGIGKIFDQLDAMGETDNTLVLFLSDNGGCHEGGIWGGDFWGNFWDGDARPGSGESYHTYGRSWANLSNTPFRMFKHWVHEGGISTPLIAHWPLGIFDRGGITSQPGHIIDIMATCCDIANANYPKTYKGKVIKAMPGKSLRPIFEGEIRDQHDAICWDHEGNKAIRMGDWKLISKHKGEWELYNLNIDRTELNNLVEIEKDRAEELKKYYSEWANRIGVRK
ncbi:arylsulfatase [Sunxiuqinia sp. A32]|uniref:arylsulfatase n=1 Tax=Sunxiuqinia sp. A32 TaxID=3461496 RepID=UPI004045DAFB